MKLNLEEIKKYSAAPFDIGGMKRVNFVLSEISDFVKQHDLNPSDISIIDVGCGNGSMTLPVGLQAYNILGIDLDESSINEAQRKNNLSNVKFSFCDIKSIGEKYDIVLCTQVLEHLEQPMQLLKDMNALLKQDGLMIITIPNGFGLSEIMGRVSKVVKKIILMLTNIKKEHNSLTTCNNSPHIQFFTKRSFKHLAETSGLKVVKEGNHTFILSGLPFNLIWMRLPLSLQKIIERIDNKIADYMPSFCVCGWYFSLKKKL